MSEDVQKTTETAEANLKVNSNCLVLSAFSVRATDMGRDPVQMLKILAYKEILANVIDVSALCFLLFCRLRG